MPAGRASSPSPIGPAFRFRPREYTGMRMRNAFLYLLISAVPLLAQAPTGVCAPNPASAGTALTGINPAWAGWGGDLANTRFQANAQIPANRVDQLKVVLNRLSRAAV